MGKKESNPPPPDGAVRPPAPPAPPNSKDHAPRAIFLLLKDGEDHGQFEVVGWSGDREKLERLAYQKEWQDYESKKDKPSPARIMSPDETAYRAYNVAAIKEII